ncbi:MAG TPA: N-6 DNA methylase [Pyrinomonadaceae bacterium]|nr:N-6 DNA methylase [Pyrinomonadaceae bacterium]
MTPEESGIRNAAKELAATTLAAARKAANEAAFRVPYQAAIAQAAAAIGVSIDPRDEHTLLEGRADTVYNRLVIEYERPGSLRPSNTYHHNQHAIQQVKDYIGGLHRRERHTMERYAGVVCDGFYYIFLRYQEHDWEIEPPVPVDVYSSERFLSYIAALQTDLATTPDNLLRDFGENTVCSRRCVSAFYHVLTTSTSSKTGALYRQWARTFSEICGYEQDSPKLDVESLARLYAVRAAARDKLHSFKLFFAIHTYYATFIKLLAVQIVNFYARAKIARITHRESIALQHAATLDSEELRDYLQTMEDGGIFRELGIRNFLEGDFFGWYLEDWTSELDEALRTVVKKLAEYSFITLDTDPDGTRDLLKRLYQNLMPDELRHDLGEYYTPDWLATQLLNQLHGGPPERVPRLPDERLLDPACGSGTFLILHLRDVRLYTRDVLLPQKKITRQQLLQRILANVVGYDLNPLAVISARTNYLLALGDLLDEIEGEIDIPIYLADSVLTPTAGDTLEKVGKIFFTTSVGDFALPQSLIKAAYIDSLANLLEQHVKAEAPADVFRQALCTAFPLDQKRDAQDISIVLELYLQLVELDRQRINGIWARIIKNAFAPLFQQPFDCVAGNPPWINWANLPDEYRQRTAGLWRTYRLFEHTGLRARTGAAMDDLSVLMLYIAADKYLKPKGKLGFVITQSIFKTAGGGEGFRRLQLGNGEHLKVIQVDDFSSVQCFEGATNRTAVLIIQKGQPTRFPVPYNFWQKTSSGSVPTEADHDTAMTRLRYRKWIAKPIDPNKINSSWITGRSRAIKHIENIIGKSDYSGRHGCHTHLSGVYWVEAITNRKDGQILISNLHDSGRIRVKNVNMAIEPDFIFPLLRGRDVHRWSAHSQASVLIPQDPEDPAKGLPERSMQRHFPKTFNYLKQFEEQLRKRSGFKQFFDPNTAPFYSIYNVGPYTFAPYKVVWREQSSLLTAAVTNSLPPQKPIVPDHKLMLCPGNSVDEVHYICALLNSIPAQFIVKSYGIETSISSHIFNYLSIEHFDLHKKEHRDLANNSQALHSATSANDLDSINELETENLRLAADYWRLERAEVIDIKQSLEELA